MNCTNVHDILVDYHKDELTPEESRTVAQHIESCPDCARESESIEETFHILRRELVPLELSAHFRVALSERITEQAAEEEPALQPEATEVTGKRRPSTRLSERHYRDLEKPAMIRLWDHARRSPYFAASILLHAAAAVIVVGLVLHISNKPEPSEPMTAQTPTPVEGDADEKIFTINMMPEGERTRLFAAAFKNRVSQPSTYAAVQQVASGVKIDVSQFATRTTLVGVFDPTLKVIKAYYADEEGQPTSQELLEKYSGATICKVDANMVYIPSTLAEKSFGSANRARVIEMGDRIEFWSEAQWQHAESMSQLVLKKVRVFIACVCPWQDNG